MSEAISLRFKYTEEEYAAAARLLIRRSTEFWVRFVLSNLICGIGIYLLTVLALDLGIFYLLSLICVVGLTWYLNLFVEPRRAFRREPKFRDEYILQFSDDGIHFKTSEIDALVQWSLYSEVLEDERFYLLVYGRGMMSVVPKRAFSSRQQQSAFDELLKRQLPVRSDRRRLGVRGEAETAKNYIPPSEPPDWR